MLNFVLILEFFLVLLFGVLFFYRHAFSYWKKKNVPLASPAKIPFGHLPSIFPFKKFIGEHYKDIYDVSEAARHKHVGIYQLFIPYYFVVDLKYIKHILVTRFEHFTDRGLYYNYNDMLSANLFLLGNQKWRTHRSKLTPTFTPRIMKLMFDGVLKCSLEMEDELEKHRQEKREIDVKTIFECFFINTVGSCVFGLDFNIMNDPTSQFRTQTKRLFDVSHLRLVKFIFCVTFPKFASLLNLRVFDRESEIFFLNLVEQTVKYRKENNITRIDFLHLLMNPKNNFTDKQLTATAVSFFNAGFEPVSATLALSLYELSQNFDIQNKTREEIRQILLKHNQNITYEALTEMKYLQQVVNETLRKYPPVMFVTRMCVKDSIMPDTDTVIDKGTRIIVPILGIHHNPKYYPTPDLFDPERFSPENKQQIKPFSYMPFGEGQRMCIGLRFALMQIKIGLIASLRKYSFSLNEKTKTPLIFNYNASTTPAYEIILDIEKCTR